MMTYGQTRIPFDTLARIERKLDQLLSARSAGEPEQEAWEELGSFEAATGLLETIGTSSYEIYLPPGYTLDLRENKYSPL